MPTQTKTKDAPIQQAGAEVVLSGARVLKQEGEALLAFSKVLGDGFSAAVNTMEKIKGRVIVTGVGKSGHVARKIAATFSSTGTPAFFVHPVEAGHGDLGMITRDDAVLALSNSGNATELSPIITYAKRFSIPLIGITSRKNSMLAEESDTVILLVEAPEACPLGLAPTTSTTLMMALGDALAVALLERHNFSANDFRKFHPGGVLGKGLVRVTDIMRAGEVMPLIPPTMVMSEALKVMIAKNQGCLGIVDKDDNLLGIITDGDLKRHMMPDFMQKKAGDIMTTNPKTISSTALAVEALAMMNNKRFTCMFVVEDGRPVGILHIHDCLQAGVA